MSPRFFRTGLLVICAAIGAAAGTLPSLAGQAAGVSLAAPAEAYPGTLLVFPFENDSRMASLDWLGEGLGELTFERLEDRGQIVLSRQERLTALEKIGLPDSVRFSHATMVKIATEADADAVVFGRFVFDGKTVTMEAQVLRISPPWLSPRYTQSSSMQELFRAHARLSWQILCALARNECRDEANIDESSFADPPPSLRLDALDDFIRGLAGSEDEESRLRSLREAARLEPAWDRPPFELGQLYFARRDCELALPWFSRVPPNRPDGPEAAFNAGVCHILRHDGVRADAAFSGLIERVRSADPKDRLPELPEFLNNRGVARLFQEKWGEAATEFERAAALDSEEPDYWVNLGIAKLAGQQPAAAVTPFERARKLDPDDKDARMLLISALESLGRNSDAAAVGSDARGETSDGGRRVTPLAPLDSAALARLARASKKFDRARLRPSGDPPAGQRQDGQETQKNQGSGDVR